MATYVDGLYKGTARGIGGKVNVEAVIEGGQLVDLVLARLKETSGIGLDAGPIVAQNIVAAGGVEGVDGLAGCTVTSNAIISATEQALAAAEGGYNDGTFTGTARGIGGQVNVVELYISYLRKKIDADRPALIRTVRGAGYIMREPQ